MDFRLKFLFILLYINMSIFDIEDPNKINSTNLMANGWIWNGGSKWYKTIGPIETKNILHSNHIFMFDLETCTITSLTGWDVIKVSDIKSMEEFINKKMEDIRKNW